MSNRIEFYLRQWTADSQNRSVLNVFLRQLETDKQLRKQLFLYRQVVRRTFADNFGDFLIVYRGMNSDDARLANRLKYIPRLKSYTIDPLVAQRYGSWVIRATIRPKDVLACYLTSASMNDDGDKEFLVARPIKEFEWQNQKSTKPMIPLMEVTTINGEKQFKRNTQTLLLTA